MAAPGQPTPPEPERDLFPDRTFPTFFADTMSSLVRFPGVVKFFFMRIDPAFTGDLTGQINNVVQVVMPTGGFAAMAIFLEFQLRDAVARKEVSQELVDQIRRQFEQVQAGSGDGPKT